MYLGGLAMVWVQLLVFQSGNIAKLWWYETKEAYHMKEMRYLLSLPGGLSGPGQGNGPPGPSNCLLRG
jgi:hypothetical protein